MAKFESGHKKVGGRKAGTPNKKSLGLLSKANECGIDIWIELLKLTQSSDLSIRLSALKEACQYLYPKRRAIEHSGNISAESLEAAETIESMTKDEQISLLEEALHRLKSL